MKTEFGIQYRRSGEGSGNEVFILGELLVHYFRLINPRMRTTVIYRAVTVSLQDKEKMYPKLQFRNLNFVVTLVLLFSVWIVSAEETPNRVKAFQDLISHPQNIERIEVRLQWLMVPTSIAPGVRILPEITNDIKFFKFAWKSNAFYIRETRNTNDFDKILSNSNVNHGLSFAGKLSGKSWDIVDTFLYSTIEAGTKGKNPVETVAALLERNVTFLRNFGIHKFPLEKVNWISPNEFSAVVGAQTPIRGLMTISNEQVSSVRLSTADGNLFRICEYSYATRESLFPAQVMVYGIKGNHQSPEVKVNYLCVKQSASELPDTYFEPEQFVDGKLLTQTVYTNNAFYDIENGKLLPTARPINKNIEMHIDPPETHRLIAMRIIIIGCFIFPLLWFGYFLINKRKNEQSNV